MSIGLLIIYGVMKMSNFAHGAFYIFGAYIYWFLFSGLGVWSIPVSLAVTFFIALLIERGLLHAAFLGKVAKPGEYALLMTYAVSLFGINAVLLVFGPVPKMPPPVLSGDLNIPYLDIAVEASRVAYFIVTISTLLALNIFFSKTRSGRAFRAVAQNRTAAQIRGVNDGRIASVAFALGCMLAALAGIFITPILSLSAGAGWIPVVKGFIVLIIAGLGSISGCVVASFALAFSEVLGYILLSPLYKDIYGFIIMVIILIIRPYGLFGEVEKRRA
jgi:branched-chain amino acid transport system permease protein